MELIAFITFGLIAWVFVTLWEDAEPPSKPA